MMHCKTSGFHNDLHLIFGFILSDSDARYKGKFSNILEENTALSFKAEVKRMEER
jgi:hypothetical protein